MNSRYLAALLGVVALFGPSLAMARELPTWHSRGGAVVKGEPVGMVGALLMLSKNKVIQFVLVDDLTDEEIVRLDTILQKKSGDDSSWSKSRHELSSDLQRHLFQSKEGKWNAFDTTKRTEPQFYFLYYSAGWCGPCHRYTPKLVKDYDAFKRVLGDKVEVIFVSDDENISEQKKYAAEFKMPWPVLDYDQVRTIDSINRWRADGIPCLVLVTRDGDVIFHSYQGEKYLGPESVVERFEPLKTLLAIPETAPVEGRYKLDLYRYLKSHTGQDSSPSLYVATFDWQKYDGIKIPPFNVFCHIDENGRVKDLEFDDATPSALQYLLRQDVEQWRFFPKLKNGKPVVGELRLPISMAALRPQK